MGPVVYNEVARPHNALRYEALDERSNRLHSARGPENATLQIVASAELLRERLERPSFTECHIKIRLARTHRRRRSRGDG